MSESLEIVILEDELIIAEYLKVILRNLNHKVAAVFDKFDECQKYLESHQVDMVFLDINLDGNLTGMDLASFCNERQIPFLFLTSYSDSKTINEALKYEPLAYMLKPFSEKEVFKTLEVVKSKLKEKKNKNSILLKEGHEFVKLKFVDILWLKADNVYTEIVTSTKRYLHRISLSDMSEQLPEQQFFRVHRSYIVNLAHLQKVSTDCVVIGSEKIPLSRGNKAKLLEVLH